VICAAVFRRTANVAGMSTARAGISMLPPPARVARKSEGKELDMARIGVLLVVLGLGSLVLPLLNMQFSFMQIMDDYQPFAGMIVAAIGGVLLFLSLQRERPAPAASAASTPEA
jgi:hypothetical protein